MVTLQLLFLQMYRLDILYIMRMYQKHKTAIKWSSLSTVGLCDFHQSSVHFSWSCIKSILEGDAYTFYMLPIATGWGRWILRKRTGRGDEVIRASHNFCNNSVSGSAELATLGSSGWEQTHVAFLNSHMAQLNGTISVNYRSGQFCSATYTFPSFVCIPKWIIFSVK